MTTPPIRRRVQSAQADRARILEVVGQEATVTGWIHTQGVGEFLADVIFPAVFYEMPMMFPGAPVINAGEPLIEHFPSADLSVVQWTTRPVTEAVKDQSPYYTGARIAVRVAGRSDQIVSVAYMFIGAALSSIGLEV